MKIVLEKTWYIFLRYWEEIGASIKLEFGGENVVIGAQGTQSRLVCVWEYEYKQNKILFFYIHILRNCRMLGLLDKLTGKCAV